MSFRRSYNDLAYGDEYDSRGGGRWDRERFERERARSRGPPRGSESFRFEEDERYGPRGSSKHLDIELDERRRGGGGGRPRPRSAVYDERDRFFEEDRSYGPRRSRPEFLEEDRIRYDRKELAPYTDRYDEHLPPRRVVERVVPRYEDDRGRGGDDVKINLRLGGDDKRDDRRNDRREERREDIRIDERFDGRRGGEVIRIDDRYDDRYGPPRRYEEPRYYRPPPPPIEPDWRDYEDYRDAKIIRERTIDRRAASRPRDNYDERRSFEDVREEVKEETRDEFKRPPGTKKGRTRMPKRLVHKRAIIEMGYPFDEEEDFYIVRLALGKDHIDECIKISEHYKEEEKTTYSFSESKTETKAIEAPPPPPPEPETEVTETVTRRIIENPNEEDLRELRAAENEAHEEQAETAAGAVETGSNHTEHGSDHGSHHTSHTHRTHRTGHSRGGPSLELTDDSPERHSRARSKSVHAARSKSRRRSRFRSKSRRRSSRYEEVDFEEEDDERRGDSGTVSGPLGLIISPSRDRHHHHHRDGRRDRDIKAEIRELEEEKRRLREDLHDDDDEVEVVKDRRGRLNLVRPSRD